MSNITLGKDSSISVRQIENGFLVTKSGMVGKGKNSRYESKDYYSKTLPSMPMKFGK